MTHQANDQPLKVAVIGMPIGQSLSPMMHTHWFEAAGLEGFYRAIEVDQTDLEKQVAVFQNEGYTGFNVTVPHKTAIMSFLDKLAPSAQQIGAVNTVKISPSGELTGFNTDSIGFIKNLKDNAQKKTKGWPRDKPAMLLGAGGAARAAATALLNDGAPMIMVCNRTREKAQTLADSLGRGRITVVDWDERHHAVVGAGLVVNTTVLGMVGQASLSLDLSGAAADTVVYDIVYKPLQTELLATAKGRGLQTVDGLGMLVHQGAAAFKIWFNEDARYDDTLRAKLLAALGEVEA